MALRRGALQHANEVGTLKEEMFDLQPRGVGFGAIPESDKRRSFPREECGGAVYAG